MSTAIPAAPARPKAGLQRSFQQRMLRIGALALAVPVAAAMLTVDAPSVAAQAGPACSGYASLTRPPDSIRVLRVRTGRVIVVPFRKYVVTVMGKEWPSYLPQPVIEAGAVAVKQYAWYHAVYSSRSANGRCFDVKDGTGDQLYKPQRARVRPDHYSAVDATWGVTLRKDGRFFMTGYRRGEKVRCGRDATGWKLYARGATDCARRGMGWREILRTYYGPSLAFVGSGGASSSSLIASTGSPTTDSAAPRTTSSAVRLSNGRWVDSTDPAAPPAAAQPTAAPPAAPMASGCFGGESGGVAAMLEEEESRLVL